MTAQTRDGGFTARHGVVLATFVIGSLALAATLRMDRADPWFPAAALAVAVIWVGGGLLGGGVRFDPGPREGRAARAVAALVLGMVLGGVFCLGALVTARIPALADQVRSVLDFAVQGSGPVIAATTAISGIGEEVFFRGALFASLPRRWQVIGSTVAYTVATALAGNPLLAFAALLLGAVTARQRRVTGGVLAPSITHVTWSLMMFYALPVLV